MIATHTHTHTTTSIAKRALMALAAATAALALVPAASEAAVKFGTNVAPDVQPSNAGDGHLCSDSTGMPGTCTWVEYEPYTNGGPMLPVAPKSGKLRRIRWIAQSPGSFRLQLVKVKGEGMDARAKVTYTSKKIEYQGQPPVGEDDDFSDTYEIESAKVKAPIKKGQYLAIKAEQTSMLRCSSGGPNTLLFQPPLRLRNPFRPVTDTDGCWLLLQGVIK